MTASVTETRSRTDEKAKATREDYLRGSKPRPPARNTSGEANQDHPRGLPPGEQAKTTREDYLRGGKPRPPARITSGGANQDLSRGLPPGEQAKITREEYLRGRRIVEAILLPYAKARASNFE